MISITGSGRAVAGYGTTTPTVAATPRPAGVILAMAAFGAGLIHLALASRAEPIFLVSLALVGTAELTVAIFALVSRRALVSQRALVRGYVLLVFLLPVLGWAVSLYADPVHASASLTLGSTAAGCALDLTAAGMIVLMLRRHATSGAVSPPHPIRFIVTLVVAAATLSIVTVPALADTQTGRTANESPMQMGSGMRMPMP
ncbi:MAG: hypothetical protein ABI130_01540 [Leifsonia sp.]